MMKPYGLPRVHGVAHPDCADLLEFGRASHVGHIRGRSGDFRNSTRNPDSKATTRRIYKRRARAAGRTEIASALRGAA